MTTKNFIISHSFFFIIILLCSFLIHFFQISIWGMVCFVAISFLLNSWILKNFLFPSSEVLKNFARNSSDNSSWADLLDELQKKEVNSIKEKQELMLEITNYRTILDSIEDPICILTNQRIIIYSNNAFNHLFHINKSDSHLLFIELTRNHEFQTFLEEATNQSVSSYKSQFTFSDPNITAPEYYDVFLTPIHESSSFLLTLRNVTSKKLANQIREDFVSNFSHEVRTPLTILTGQIQLLKESLQSEVHYEHAYDLHFVKIETNARRLINLFNDLLRLNSIQTIKGLKREFVNLDEMLQSLTQELTINYPQKNIQFEFDLKQTNFYVDYNLFEQAMINLIDNAIKYIHNSGVIKFKSYSNDDWDYLIIEDNGIGIPENHIHRIFERFFRVDSSRSSEIMGTGLGLAIVKHIVQKHQGKIKVQSLIQQGTIFTLSFPKN